MHAPKELDATDAPLMFRWNGEDCTLQIQFLFTPVQVKRLSMQDNDVYIRTHIHLYIDQQGVHSMFIQL